MRLALDPDSFIEKLKGAKKSIRSYAIHFNQRYIMNPPFQDKKCESGGILLFGILHFCG